MKLKFSTSHPLRVLAALIAASSFHTPNAPPTATAYIATIYTDDHCNFEAPTSPFLSIVRVGPTSTTPGPCIVPAESPVINGESFSLVGCASGGLIKLFEDRNCSVLVFETAGTPCEAFTVVNSFQVFGC